jgi:hypothetical protein
VDRNEVGTAGGPVVITWSATNATSCTASGGWSGTKAISGSETVTIARDTSLILTCANTTSAGTTTAAATARVTTIKAIFKIPTGTNRWMSIPADLDGDGDEEIVMTSMEKAGPFVVSPWTPVYILGVANNKVTDRAADFFGAATIPKVGGGKATAGDFDGDGRIDLLFCDRGRLEGPMPPQFFETTTPGMWGAQPQAYLQTTPGRMVNVTDRMPQENPDAWGCSAGDVDKSGRQSIVIAAFKNIQAQRNAALFKWDGTRFNKTMELVQGQFDNWGWSATADFDKDGFADITGTAKVLWGGGTGFSKLKDLAPSQAQQAGYTFMRGSVIADFNGDGYPDLLRESGLSDATLAGTKFALYTSDRLGNLVEKLDAFPPVASYGLAEFSNELTALDINFDGFLDIVSFGYVATFNAPARLPTAVWLNNGSGVFRFSNFSDELDSFAVCPSGISYADVYFLKTKDPKAFNLVVGSCAGGHNGYMARRVTPQYPLKFTP